MCSSQWCRPISLSRADAPSNIEPPFSVRSVSYGRLATVSWPRDDHGTSAGLEMSGSKVSTGKLLRRNAIRATMGYGLVLSGFARASSHTSSNVRSLASPEQLRPGYDYVVIGAGSAGCVLARRLCQAGRQVLVMEAGSAPALPAIANPPDWPELQGSDVDWRYTTLPQPGLAGRTIPYPRGNGWRLERDQRARLPTRSSRCIRPVANR